MPSSLILSLSIAFLTLNQNVSHVSWMSGHPPSRRVCMSSSRRPRRRKRNTRREVEQPVVYEISEHKSFGWPHKPLSLLASTSAPVESTSRTNSDRTGPPVPAKRRTSSRHHSSPKKENTGTRTSRAGGGHTRVKCARYLLGVLRRRTGSSRVCVFYQRELRVRTSNERWYDEIKLINIYRCCCCCIRIVKDSSLQEKNTGIRRKLEKKWVRYMCQQDTWTHSTHLTAGPQHHHDDVVFFRYQ